MALSGDEDKLYELLAYGIPKMQELGEVFVSDALKRLHVAAPPKVSVGISLAGDMLELSMSAGICPWTSWSRFCPGMTGRRNITG